MANRDVNKVMLIGNLTRDPELRYTPQGTAVANFTVATNRSWVADGVEKEAVDFHNVVSWNKLAELCDQLLQKGTKVYVEGRLQTRNWVGDDGIKRYKTEVNIDEMIVLVRGKGSATMSAPSDEMSEDSEDMGEISESESEVELDIDELLEEIGNEEKEAKEEKEEDEDEEEDDKKEKKTKNTKKK
jgi:single stranded DNA-binding protein